MNCEVSLQMQKPADTLAWRCRQACDSMHVKFMVASRPHPDQGPRERVMYTIMYIYTYAYVLVCMYIVKAPYDFADCSSGVFCLGLLSPRYSKPDKYLQCFPRYIALYALLLLSCDTKPIHLTPATDYYCFQFRVECLMTRLPKILQKMPHSGQVSCSRHNLSVTSKIREHVVCIGLVLLRRGFVLLSPKVVPRLLVCMPMCGEFTRR